MASDRGGDMRLIYDNIKEQAAVMPDPVLVTLHKESLLADAVTWVEPAVRRAGCVQEWPAAAEMFNSGHLLPASCHWAPSTGDMDRVL